MTPISLHDPWTGEDKKLHFAGGAALAAATFAPAMLVGATPFRALLAGFVFSSIVAWAKEGWDSVHPPHQPSVQDAIVTMAGAALATAAAGFLLWMLRLA